MINKSPYTDSTEGKVMVLTYTAVPLNMILTWFQKTLDSPGRTLTYCRHTEAMQSTM